MIEPTRFAELPAGLFSLTATARGMVKRTMVRAAQQAYGELMPAVARAGLMDQLRSVISLCPDDAQGPDDPQCRFVAGVVFGYAMADGSGFGAQPALELSGSLAWQALTPGRHAVFTHLGPYDQLYRSWHAIYHDWLPGCGQTLRDDPPLELMLSDASVTPAAQLRTEIWIPLR
jgi:AraC family transcriptional regulator